MDVKRVQRGAEGSGSGVESVKLSVGLLKVSPVSYLHLGHSSPVPLLWWCCSSPSLGVSSFTPSLLPTIETLACLLLTHHPSPQEEVPPRLLSHGAREEEVDAGREVIDLTMLVSTGPPAALHCFSGLAFNLGSVCVHSSTEIAAQIPILIFSNFLVLGSLYLPFGSGDLPA